MTESQTAEKHLPKSRSLSNCAVLIHSVVAPVGVTVHQVCPRIAVVVFQPVHLLCVHALKGVTSSISH